MKKSIYHRMFCYADITLSDGNTKMRLAVVKILKDGSFEKINEGELEWFIDLGTKVDLPIEFNKL